MCLFPKQYGFKEGLTSPEYFDLLTGLGDWENHNKSSTATLTPQEQLERMLKAMALKENPPTHEQVRQMVERAGYVLLMDIGAYWGHLLHNCKITITDRIPTACVYVSKTESVVCMDINPLFFAGVKDTDRVGIIYHELQHIALAHVKRATDATNHKQWNYATDLAINSPLVKVKPTVMTLPEDAGGGHGSGGTEAGNPSESDDGTDMDAMAREVLIRALKRAAEQTTAGSVPQFVEEAIEALEKQRPKNWHKELRRFYRSTVEGNDRERTWARPNRRYGLWEAGSKVGEGKRLVIGIDTSGSMSTEDIQHILAECHSMLKCGVDAKVMFFDTEVHSTIKLTKHSSVKECGRGGTDFKDFFNKAVKQRPDALVVFTDGDDGSKLHADVSKKISVLWVLVDGDRTSGSCCNFGRKVLLDK